MWSIGCIFAEMVMKKPLFHGDSEIDQIFRIFKIMSTPHEDCWPGVTSLPDYKNLFPKWRKDTLNQSVHRLDEVGIELLRQLFIYNPIKRISAKKALEHEYFDDLDLGCCPAAN